MDRKVQPGEEIVFIHTLRGAVPLSQYKGDVDIKKYRQLLTRSLYVLVQPFGISREKINSFAKNKRQTELKEFLGHRENFTHSKHGVRNGAPRIMYNIG